MLCITYPMHCTWNLKNKLKAANDMLNLGISRTRLKNAYQSEALELSFLVQKIGVALQAAVIVSKIDTQVQSIIATEKSSKPHIL